MCGPGAAVGMYVCAFTHTTLAALGSTFTCDPVNLAETILEEGDPLLGLNRSAYNRVVRSAFGATAIEAHNRVLLDQLFDSLDSTGSGRITIAEATGALTALCATTADQHTAAAFAIYDSEHGALGGLSTAHATTHSTSSPHQTVP